MTFNTGNPIGSTDARDLSDNTENMDYLENSTTELTRADRLGTVRKTRHGMEVAHDAQIAAHESEHDAQIAAHESEHDAQIAAHETEHDAQMQAFESDFDGRLAGMAFTRVGSFTTGATLTDMRQVLVWEVSQGGDGHEYGWAGTFPKVVVAGATPATSGGIGAGAWVDRTDVVLRDQLAESTGATKVGTSDGGSVQDFIDAQTFANVDAMLAFNGLVVGQKYSTGFTTWRYIGGGGTIDRFKPLNDVHIDDFGASTSQAVDSLGAINRALAVKGTVRAGVGTYYISSEILIGSDTHFVGAGKFYTIIRPNQTFIDTAAINGLNIIKNIEAANPTLPLYNANHDIVISDMQFRYNDSNGGALDKINCIGLNNAKRITVRDCYAANLSQHFVDISGCDEVLIENNTVVNGYWASIQIDNGGGLYNITGFPTTTKSNNVKVIRNTLTGSKAGVGAIHMHKKGGDNVTIEDNTIVGGVSGIVIDDYFANTYPIAASSAVRILNNYVSVSGDALNIGKSLTDAQISGNTLISTGSSFAMRLQAGDGSIQYWYNATVSDNKCYGNIYIVGLVRSAIYGNNFKDQTTEAVVSTRETVFSTNNLEIKGVIHKDISFTDPRDGVTVRNYTLSNNKVAYNVCNNGSGVGFAVESSGFNLIEYIDNTPFATANSYNFSLAVVKTGLIINDFFRKALRASTVSDLPEPIIGQQAFYLRTKQPVWYDGTAWIYADGSTVFP